MFATKVKELWIESKYNFRHSILLKVSLRHKKCASWLWCSMTLNFFYIYCWKFHVWNLLQAIPVYYKVDTAFFARSGNLQNNNTPVTIGLVSESHGKWKNTWNWSADQSQIMNYPDSNPIFVNIKAAYARRANFFTPGRIEMNCQGSLKILSRVGSRFKAPPKDLYLTENMSYRKWLNIFIPSQYL